MEVGGAAALARPVLGFKKVNPFNLTTSFNSHTHNKYSSFVVKAIQSQNVDEGSNKVSFSKRERRPQNVLGDFFVDHTCIDCDTCRWMAPEVFSRADGMSAVSKQPESKEERVKALQALLSCPTSSIRTEKPPADILEVQKTFPIPVDEQRIPGIYHCGYHSEKSFGAASYFIVHPEGNILVDSPKYTDKLARRFEMMGGARYMFLTHRDDIADHMKWSKRLGCDRIIHSEEVDASTAEVECKLEGNGPWKLADDLELIHTPGHTKGSVCLLHRSLKVLFAGDHIAMDESGLCISEIYNWFSVPVQIQSVKKLTQFDFEWILPGHGRRAEFRDTEVKNSALESFVAASGHST
ncbi:uncharacterized protein LOC141678410 [Apium graveolens]|uniref:uncharacterized protein LOC141678410 n=1 Tax=Apium graveolens TaxID=4045 RepID=UPI003D7ABCAC